MFALLGWMVKTSEEGSYLNYGDGWGCAVTDRTKAQYESPLSNIAGKPLVYMFATYINCDKLITTPAIPSTVKELSYVFKNCTSLTTIGRLPSGTIALDNAFYGCTKLTGVTNLPKYKI